MKEIELSSRKWLWVAPFAALAVSMSGAQLAHAEPLTPLAPNEIQYLDQLRQVFAAKHDPTAFRSDGELLGYGQYACAKRRAGIVGQEATFQSPAVTQVAFVYLCP